jgi:hypothetical protein
MDNHFLKNMRVFVSGPIDRVPDDGIGWRREIKDLCFENKIDMMFLDPCNKPNGLGEEIGEEKRKLQRCRTEDE